jgi:hypothetical protein
MGAFVGAAKNDALESLASKRGQRIARSGNEVGGLSI